MPEGVGLNTYESREVFEFFKLFDWIIFPLGVDENPAHKSMGMGPQSVCHCLVIRIRVYFQWTLGQDHIALRGKPCHYFLCKSSDGTMGEAEPHEFKEGFSGMGNRIAHHRHEGGFFDFVLIHFR